MGAWGSALYANDTTCDVRDKYMDCLREQLSNQEAYEKTFEAFKECIGYEDEEPLFWYALAETQWKAGRLMPEVKEKALGWIEKCGGLSLWEESGNSSGWKKTLKKLRCDLETEKPKERKIRKSEDINQNPWNLGDVYAYRYHSKDSKYAGTHGKYILMQKVGEGASYLQDESVAMRICIFDKLFDYMPTLEDMRGVRLTPFLPPSLGYDLCMNVLMVSNRQSDYPAKHLTFIGNTSILPNKILDIYKFRFFQWIAIESGSYNNFQHWQNVKYEETEEGVFRCINLSSYSYKLFK